MAGHTDQFAVAAQLDRAGLAVDRAVQQRLAGDGATQRGAGQWRRAVVVEFAADLAEVATDQPGKVVHAGTDAVFGNAGHRSEEHTSELQSLMRISYAVFCLIKKKN